MSNSSTKKKRLSALEFFLERVRGIEPPYRPWEGRVLPLNYTRVDCSSILQSFRFDFYSKIMRKRKKFTGKSKLSVLKSRDFPFSHWEIKPPIRVLKGTVSEDHFHRFL